MGRVGAPQLILVLFIVLLLFGARRLPDLAGALGRSMKEFRKETAQLSDGDEPEGRSRSRSEAERRDGDTSA